MAGWREDLQGKQRRDSLTLERDVFVTTNYGQVQGFKVYMYDNPDPKSFYRPYHSTVDRVMGECSVFLGIPYALPPTFEGRFKPPRPHRGWQLLQAVDFGPACPQPVRYTGATKGIMDMDEDCLYLNVYSPKVRFGEPFIGLLNHISFIFYRPALALRKSIRLWCTCTAVNLYAVLRIYSRATCWPPFTM